MDAITRTDAPPILLGIDASLSRSAFLLTDGARQLRYSVCETSPREPLPERLGRIAIAAPLLISRVASEWGVPAAGLVSMVVLEEPGFGGAGGQATTAVARAQGAVLAGLSAASWCPRFEIVPVSRVRSALGIKIPRGKGMAKAAVARWLEAYPGIIEHFPRTPRTGELDNDLADALVLALYGMQLLKEEAPDVGDPA
jgi:hypothetical protein